MKRVFISGPYICNDVAANVARALAVADDLMTLGAAPYCPHLSHFSHLAHQRDYEDWLALDLCWLEQCEAVYRLFGESPGADRECARARELGLPVFEDWQDLKCWLFGEVDR